MFYRLLIKVDEYVQSADKDFLSLLNRYVNDIHSAIATTNHEALNTIMLKLELLKKEVAAISLSSIDSQDKISAVLFQFHTIRNSLSAILVKLIYEANLEINALEKSLLQNAELNQLKDLKDSLDNKMDALLENHKTLSVNRNKALTVTEVKTIATQKEHAHQNAAVVILDYLQEHLPLSEEIDRQIEILHLTINEMEKKLKTDNESLPLAPTLNALKMTLEHIESTQMYMIKSVMNRHILTNLSNDLSATKKLINKNIKARNSQIKDLLKQANTHLKSDTVKVSNVISVLGRATKTLFSTSSEHEITALQNEGLLKKPRGKPKS